MKFCQLRAIYDNRCIESHFYIPGSEALKKFMIHYSNAERFEIRFVDNDEIDGIVKKTYNPIWITYARA